MTDIFLDTANLKDIEELTRWGIIKGLTTNQKIFSKEKGVNFEKHAKRILDMIKGPVSLEAPSNKIEDVINDGREFAKLAKNVIVKVPMLPDGSGLEATRILESEGIKTNVTIMMNLNQAFLAASAGASYMSLFFGRIRDYYNQEKALEIVANTRKMIDDSGFKTKLIIGSIRKPEDIEYLLPCNPHIITIPPKILRQMPFHQRTVETLEEFDKAWEEFCRHEQK